MPLITVPYLTARLPDRHSKHVLYRSPPARSVAPAGEADPPYGVRVAMGVNATCHQHFFCMRLDPAIDDEQGGRCGGRGT